MKELSDMRGEVASELAHLKSAQEDVGAVAAETKQVVDNAQTHLWTQKQSVEVAEKQAEEAKADSRAKQEEYDKLHQDAMTEEATLDNEVVAREMQLRECNRDLEAAQKRIDAAQAKLDEANDIASTPDVTRQLSEQIADTRAAVDVQKREVDLLANTEHEVRERTRQQRLIFMAVIVVAVIVVAVILWFVLGAGAAGQTAGTSATTTAATTLSSTTAS
jgi:chromosome segregation ATPase